MPEDRDVAAVSADGRSPADALLPLPAWGAETREVRLARLLRKARELPATAGVYLMKDHKGVVLYVGKAGRLPDRVSSYFVPSAELGALKGPMLELVHDFEHLVCEGEWEALLTEARLIKDIGPRFNARLTDDKTFPYLAVTVREDFPRVMVTRDLSDPLLKGARIFGPFTGAGALREAVTLSQKVFKFRTCSLDIVEGDPKNKHFRPCILHAIGQCTAPCAAKIGKAAYSLDVERFLKFMGSKRSVMLRDMREEMEKASASQEFERAASLRDQIRAIEKLDDRARRGRKDRWQPETEAALVNPKKGLESLRRTLGLTQPIRCIEAIDIAHLHGGEVVGSKVCFVDGRPLKNEYRRYRIRGKGVAPNTECRMPNAEPANDDYAAIREVVSRRYREAGEGHELYPDVIVIDGGLGQLHAALEAIAQMAVMPPMVISLAKKEELIYAQERTEPIRLGRDNLGLRLVQAIRDEAHRFAQHYHHVLRRKRTLEED